MSSLREKFLQKFFRSRTGKKILQTVGGPAAIQALESALEPITGVKNRYEAFRTFLRMDPELNNAVTRLALLTQFAYKGIMIHVDKEMSEEERVLLQRAQEAAEQFDFRGRFFSIAKHLLRDGDEVFVIHIDNAANSVGVQQIQPLPISKLTAVENREQIGDPSAKILGANYYILNEGTSSEQIFPENDEQKVFHISVDNYGEEITDLYGRYTFGVWSESPLECLRSRVLWKQAILITDILWRYRNVPREVHELDTSQFSPEKFKGNTFQERFQNYQTAIKNVLKEHAKEIRKKKVDQGYVVPKGTKIYFTEPKMQYSSPNELIEQINKSIREGLGAYNVEAGTYATALVVSSYVVLLPDLLAYKIKRALLEVLKIHLMKKYNVPDEELRKLDIRLSLVLEIFKGELVRQMAVVAATGTHTLDELRAMVGKDPLTDEQISRLVEITKRGRTGQYAQTIFDLLRDTSRQREPSEHLTPESRREKQKT